MSTQFNDLSLLAKPQQTFVPQTFSSTGAGTGVQISTTGSALVNAMLEVGAVNTLTSLIVKIQASTDNSAWVDCTDEDGNVVVFTTVTTLNHIEWISFQIPTALLATSAPYIYVRMFGTLVGTSVVLSGSFHTLLRYGPGVGSQSAPPSVIN